MDSRSEEKKSPVPEEDLGSASQILPKMLERRVFFMLRNTDSGEMIKRLSIQVNTV